MTSLPISASLAEPPGTSFPPAPPSALGDFGCEDERSLLHAFRSFSGAAASLERSYGRLRAEVERLERELAASNGELTRTSEENCRMRDYLDRILEGLPCGVLVISDDGSIRKTNPEALRAIGLQPPKGELRTASQLPSDVQELLKCSRETGTETEMQVRASDDALRWLAVRHAALPEDCSVFISRDITQRKRLREIEARAEIDHHLAEISTLLAHEIRNPLGSMELFAGLLAESDLEPEQRRSVEHIQAGLRTLAATVNNVLQFHSVGELQRAPVDLGELLAWARHFFLPLAWRSEVTLSLQNRLLGVAFSGDRHRLEQVLLNLILNSIQITPSGGWIEISGRKNADGGHTTIEVADTGPGIPIGDLEGIFEAGFSRRSGSPGLGLAVCRKIVEQHGGTISAANRESGAIFTVTLPIVGSKEGAQP